VRIGRKILVVTGKRGGFGAIIPTIKELNRKPGVETVIVATDQHLYEDFGSTYQEVQKWFDIRHLVPMDQAGDTPLDRTKALSRCMDWMGSIFQQENPDLLLVLGDRGEIMSTVAAAIHFRIPVAHIQGGDVTGNIDEYIRHAITKMAHLHFPSTEQSRRRILQMGEEAWRVHVVGDPHLDMIHQEDYTPQEEIYRKFSLTPERPIILVLQHSDTCRDNGVSYSEMKAVLDAVNRFDAQKILVYPCTDCDYKGIIRAIEECRDGPEAQIYPNIECRDFWGLQNVASVFVGNSSAGIIEAPAFKLPTVTVGDRQQDRERADNCIQAEPDTEAVFKAIEKCLYDKKFKHIVDNCISPYGTGQACFKIAEVLSSVELGPQLFNKRITY
jgi:UDP-N-acetylglucosamine 2-epimerase (non-hydrolysing)/GDP/UDP-N,N'-diacetylbacillosamine 2-epimerase (hydrolysing)